jgi:predicted transcriptional regulator
MIRGDEKTEKIFRSIFSVTELALDIIKQYIPEDSKKDREEIFYSIKRVSHTQKARCQKEYNQYTDSQEQLSKYIKGIHLENARQIYYRIKMTIERYCDEKTSERVLAEIKKQLFEMAEEEGKYLADNL